MLLARAWLLLLVLLSLLPSHFAGTNESNFITPQCVNNNQNPAHRDEWFFIKTLIWNCNCQSIWEHWYCISKVDTMFVNIGCCFLSILLVSHLNYIIHICTYYQDENTCHLWLPYQWLQNAQVTLTDFCCWYNGKTHRLWGGGNVARVWVLSGAMKVRLCLR